MAGKTIPNWLMASPVGYIGKTSTPIFCKHLYQSVLDHQLLSLLSPLIPSGDKGTVQFCRDSLSLQGGLPAG